MKFTQCLAVAIFVCLTIFSLQAQKKTYAFDFKKGEVFDILLITNKPNNEPLFDKYKKTAFPVAMGLSYQPLPGFAIAELTQGNHQPEVMGLGKWSSLEKREQFLVDIEEKVLDFHQQRRALWSNFELTYFEMPQDVSFEINRNKVNVVTAYWQKDGADFAKFKKAFAKKTKKAGGATLIELTNGTSPFGYYYQPDYLVITEWDDRAEFDAFYQENIKMDRAAIQHVHQFLLN